MLYLEYIIDALPGHFAERCVMDRIKAVLVSATRGDKISVKFYVCKVNIIMTVLTDSSAKIDTRKNLLLSPTRMGKQSHPRGNNSTCLQMSQSSLFKLPVIPNFSHIISPTYRSAHLKHHRCLIFNLIIITIHVTLQSGIFLREKSLPHTRQARRN
jgi:hypothetical protein